MPRPRILTGLALWCTCAWPALHASPDSVLATRPATPAPVLATEDSIRQYELPEPVRVSATRVPLLDIIRKAQEGERRRYDGLSSLAYTQLVKVTIGFDKKTEYHEVATRVYWRTPDRWREVRLRDEEYVIEADGTRKPKNEDEGPGGGRGTVRVEVGSDDADHGRAARTLVDLPDYLERLDRYDFKILHRSVRTDQVLYEIGFEPKSDFEILPDGRMWILTGGYQVVREELHLERLPLPGILKDLDLLTREWQQVEGRWLQKRITGRAKFGLPGFLRAPRSIEIAIAFTDYELNPVLDPGLFEGSKP